MSWCTGRASPPTHKQRSKWLKLTFSILFSRSSLSSNILSDDLETGATPLAQLNELLQHRASNCSIVFEEEGVQLMPPFTIVCFVEALNLRTEVKRTSGFNCLSRFSFRNCYYLQMQSQCLTNSHDWLLRHVDRPKKMPSIGQRERCWTWSVLWVDCRQSGQRLICVKWKLIQFPIR